MKKSLSIFATAILASLSLAGCTADADLEGAVPPALTKATATAQVIFEDNFDQPGGIPDSAYWSLCPNQSPAWARYLSESYDQAYLKDGKLVLVGEKIGGEYKTGGVQTLGKLDFKYGKVEVCARFTNSAQGGWPAIWMMPAQPMYPGWPDGGEIDIMEQLNHDTYVWHTIHNHYRDVLGYNTPNHTATGGYNTGEFNVYALDWSKDALIFSVNGVIKLTYSNLRLADEAQKMQWPFDAPFYLILNQALGGADTWPGAITDSQLPARMEVDWVKITQFKE